MNSLPDGSPSGRFPCYQGKIQGMSQTGRRVMRDKAVLWLDLALILVQGWQAGTGNFGRTSERNFLR